ncbi:MAG: Hypothetical protein AJITA_00667 [Acetilactobacillus jinshanensis]
MTLTGVDLVHGRPTKWKVQNSWGDKIGHKGYFVMTDDWMNKYVYEMAVNLKYLPKAQQKINDQKFPLSKKDQKLAKDLMQYPAIVCQHEIDHLHGTCSTIISIYFYYGRILLLYS